MPNQSSGTDVGGAVERWAEGLDEELAFWYRWLRGKGDPWPEDYKRRVDPRAELQPHLRMHIPARFGSRVRILDVGSPIRPIKGEAERLGELLPDSSFDLACAFNCLDHSYDPLRSIREMVKLVKPGRAVVLDHVIDEGERMRYAGLHQWNFRADDGRFVIWRPGVEVDAHAQLLPDAEVEIAPIADPGWLRVVLRRR